MLIKIGNYYLNLDNVADVVDNGDHIMVRFNFPNPSTQGPQGLGWAETKLRSCVPCWTGSSKLPVMVRERGRARVSPPCWSYA